MLQTLKDFLKLESSSGVILLIAAIFAMLIANSPLASLYNLFIDMPVEIRIGAFFIGKPLLLWINDGLMAIFFFLVGLELKREILEGEFADINKIILPAVAAVGGIAIPALIYTAINWHNPLAQQGWAIPAATDIAFALAILALLGKRIPLSLKVFLVSLAIFDDIGAILIIALFYTQNLSLNALGVSAVCIVLLFFINRKRVIEFTPYLLIGILMWISLLKSGVHATLAGVLLAFFIPMRNPKNPAISPVKTLEHDLHTGVAYGILPLFAFANAGVDLGNFGFEALLHPVSLGVAAGLFMGKQLGVFLFCWVAIKLRFAKLPNDTSWSALYGVALLSGVGFTMSLFIGSLAFETSQHNQLFDERIGIIAGSLLSGIAGYLVLKYSYRHADFSNNE